MLKSSVQNQEDTCESSLVEAHPSLMEESEARNAPGINAGNDSQCSISRGKIYTENSRLLLWLQPSSQCQQRQTLRRERGRKGKGKRSKSLRMTISKMTLAILELVSKPELLNGRVKANRNLSFRTKSANSMRKKNCFRLIASVCLVHYEDPPDSLLFHLRYWTRFFSQEIDFRSKESQVRELVLLNFYGNTRQLKMQFTTSLELKKDTTQEPIKCGATICPAFQVVARR